MVDLLINVAPIFFLFGGGGCINSLMFSEVLSVLYSLTIILMRKREPIAFLFLLISCKCYCSVARP